ncbi:enoyl-CoA hydratase [Mycobacterium malmoense]|uniref:enoyl-CoA hydratase/isomerase family protein n=1 Tax=Mycobacterium malmoense TaxID=1780 RepID=UPI00080B83AE|nr:enoyl-CoA hydratase [Mycobacterium malmoense]
MTSATANTLVETSEPGIVVVTLNRPHRLNALNQDLIVELTETIATLENDPQVRVVILTGAGRGFCAGADIKGDDDGTAAGSPVQPGVVAAMLQAQERIATVHERIHLLRKPVVAAVNGVAVGGGFSLTLACDVRIAASSARFGAVFPEVGLSACDMGTSYLLPRLVGASRSAELLLTARVFDAAEAQSMGLVSDVVEPEQLLERALVTARAIARFSPLSVWMTKETMWRTVDAPSLGAAIDMENRTQIMCAVNGFGPAASTPARPGAS